MDIAELAGEAARYFETRTRDDGSGSFVTLKDRRPDWVQTLAMEAHGDMMPEDWRYATIGSALAFIAEVDGGEDAIEDGMHEWADAEVDVYTGARLKWLASHLSRPGYVDGAAEEFGHDGPVDIVALIGMGQYAEACEVYALVVSALRERAEEVSDDDDA